MKHKIYYDEDKQLLHIEFIGDVTVEDCAEIASVLKSLTAEQKSGGFLIDVAGTRTTTLVDKELRQALSQEFVDVGKVKTAIIGATPVLRMLVKALVAMIGTSDISRFFTTEEEAIAWLKEEDDE